MAPLIFMSQIPNFHKLSGLSVLAAGMSFTYSLIGIGLSITKIAGGANPKTSLIGIKVGPSMTSSQKVCHSFQALGNIAFAYSYSDTIKSGKPESKAMKKATTIAITVITLFYMLCGILGYIAFGDNAPGNFLAGFGHFKPAWIIDFANACIVIHLVGAYQIFTQPVFQKMEEICHEKWPESNFVTKEYGVRISLLGTWNVNLSRVVWRTCCVITTCGLAVMMPFFNDVMGLLGACSFWPLTVYFPVEMHIVRNKIPKYSHKWVWLNILSSACFIISLLVAGGSIQGITTELKKHMPFVSEPGSSS